MLKMIDEAMTWFALVYFMAMAICVIRGMHKTGKPLGMFELLGILWRGDIQKMRSDR